MLSEDGRWVAVRKLTAEKDTFMVFDTNHPESPHFKRAGISEGLFIGENELLLKSKDQVEILNLKNGKSIHYEGIQSYRFLKHSHQLLLHYHSNELQLLSEDGKLRNSISLAQAFFTNEREDIFVVSKNRSAQNEVFIFTPESKRKIFTTKDSIANISPDENEEGLIIYVRNQKSLLDLYHIDVNSMETSKLSDLTNHEFEAGIADKIGHKEGYFLNLLAIEKEVEEKLVDIWYGSDYQLEKKFKSFKNEFRAIWEPVNTQLIPVGNPQLPKAFDTGNGRFYVSFNPYLLQTYTEEKPKLALYLFDSLKKEYSLLDTIQSSGIISDIGKHFLYKKGKRWYLYDFQSKSKQFIDHRDLSNPYFTADGKAILFEGKNKLWMYQIQAKTLNVFADFPGFNPKVLNYKLKGLLGGFEFYKKTVKIGEPLVIQLENNENNIQSYLLLDDQNQVAVIPPTFNRIKNFEYDADLKTFCYLEENYNLPPRLVLKKMNEDPVLVLQSNKGDSDVYHYQQEISSYMSNVGDSLKGILYYPAGFDPLKKYPMVVHVYEKQNQYANQYLQPTYKNDLGFNIRLFVENGYFVYLPDLVVEKDGPGIGALNCLHNAMDALTEHSIDLSKVGLIGHSFGGYETNFIATHSKRFQAYVSGSGQSDILQGYHSFNYNFLFPDYKRIETGQYHLPQSFYTNKTLYFDNNPIYYAENVNAPVLLWTGTDDLNVPMTQTMSFYNALKRNNKMVIALFYKNEKHSLKNPNAQIDLTNRILEWFNYFLKGKHYEWIDVEMQTNASR